MNGRLIIQTVDEWKILVTVAPDVERLLMVGDRIIQTQKFQIIRLNVEDLPEVVLGF